MEESLWRNDGENGGEDSRSIREHGGEFIETKTISFWFSRLQFARAFS